MSLKQPVQYPVKYYSHADADAPQLADADGVIKTILKACLVTGYGAKEGAGWTSLFEDDYRIILRRPLGTGNPPDIKIENGVINGSASHRIVSQDDPTGLDDPAELAAVNLLARNSKHGVEWYLVVSDFGFILCYQMGDNGNSYKNHVLLCSSTQKMQDASDDSFFVSSTSQINRNGTSTFAATAFFDSKSFVKDMRTGVENKIWHLIKIEVAEKHFNNDYLAQRVIAASNSILPFYIPVPNNYSNNPITSDDTRKVTSEVLIDSRPMLRYFNILYDVRGGTPLYIPLDYWEL